MPAIPTSYIVPFDPLGNPLGTILTAAPYPDPASVYRQSAICDPENDMFEDIYLSDLWASCLLAFDVS